MIAWTLLGGPAHGNVVRVQDWLEVFTWIPPVKLDANSTREQQISTQKPGYHIYAKQEILADGKRHIVGVHSSITSPTALADLWRRRHQRQDAGQEVWIVGKHRGCTADGHTAWDLQGVFTSKEAALAACRDRSDFVGPATLNKELPQDAQTWPGCEYPLS